MSETAAAPVTAPELVKAVDAAIKAAGANETGRTCDSLKHLAKQQVTAALLLSTGAGKKVLRGWDRSFAACQTLKLHA